MVGISTYPIEKVRDSPYPYLYPVNTGIPRQNGDGSNNTHKGEIICHLYKCLYLDFKKGLITPYHYFC